MQASSARRCSGVSSEASLPELSLEDLPAAAYVCDRRGVVRHFNRRAVALWGQTPQPAVAEAHFCGAHRLYYPDGTFMPHVCCPMADALATGQPQHNCQAIIERPDGTRSSILVNISVLRDSAGQIVGAINVLQDITDWQPTAFVEQARLALLAAEVSQTLVRDHDLADMLAHCAEAVRRRLDESGVAIWLAEGAPPKLSLATSVGINPASLVPQELAAEIDFGQASQGTEQVEIDLFAESRPETAWLASLGGTFQSAVAIPMTIRERTIGILLVLLKRKGTSGELQALTSLSHTLALGIRHHQTKRDWQDSERRYRDLIELAPSGIAIVQDGQFVYINRTGCRMIGIDTPERLIGTAVADLNHPEDLPASFARQEKIASTGEAVPLRHFRIRRFDGEYIDVESCAGPCTHEGRPAMQLIARDVTDRKRAEEDQRRLETKMLHLQKLESLGVLAGGIAHDFNNLLTSILGFANLALDDLPTENPVRAWVGEIENAALRAADLTRQMLAYSGKGKFVVEPIDLDRLVREMTQLLQTVISKKARLQLDLQPAPLEGDATQVRQIVMNLITNASDALSGEGTIRVETGTRQVSSEQLQSPFLQDDLPAGQYAFVRVQDTGGGMSPETLARVFEPFFSTKFTGRGLGLAAVLGIVRGHRGTIHVESEEGVGTSFEVLFPVLEPALARPALGLTALAPTPLTRTTLAPAAPAPAQKERVIPPRGTVLVIEDEENVRMLAKRLLTRAGFHVLVAADGLAGLALFEQQPARFGAVIVDWTMPRLDGIDVVHRLRALRADIPIVLMSGYSEHDISSRVAEANVNAFIQKPFAASDFVTRICRAVPALANATAACESADS
jgi:PAS domain S-box-containing protein